MRNKGGKKERFKNTRFQTKVSRVNKGRIELVEGQNLNHC